MRHVTHLLARVNREANQDQNYRWAPVNELVLLQVLAALGDVSGHVEKIHHGQTGRMLLFTWRQSLILAAACVLWEEGLEKQRQRSN